MRIRPLWLVLTLAGVALACGESPPPVATVAPDIQSVAAPTATVRVPVQLPTAVATPYDQHVQPVADPTATPDVQPVSDSGLDNVPPPKTYIEARNQLGGGSALLRYTGPESIEEIMLRSDTIARADYLSSRSSVTSVGDTWIALHEFRFEVHEYLKGSGTDEIGVVVGAYFDTEADAEWAKPLVAKAHDTQWDGREAILFLNYPDVAPGASRDYEIVPQLGAGQYWLTHVGGSISGYLDLYSVASKWRKLWLPEALQATRDSTTQKFLLDAPGDSNQARSATATSGSTISLVDLKGRISDLEAEASAGGTADYRECVEFYYRSRRTWAEHFAINGRSIRQTHYSIKSGLPAGTVLDTKNRLRPAGAEPLRLWFEGPDKNLVRWTQTATTTSVEHTLRQVTARPLPPGTYTYNPNGLTSRAFVCDKDFSFRNNRETVTLTVTPSGSRITHEAFFDPVDIGSAVGADSSNGVLKPNAFMLNGTTTTISSLKWEDGAVSMTLSPTTSLADYAIDFIDVTGTTTLSLTSGNASTTALTWNVPDKPWVDSDLLMLRIHKPISTDATLSALALSGVDLTFDPATTTYAASVPATTTQTTVTPTTNHASATYVVKLADVVDADGTIPLAAGDNVITIDVTAEDATTTQTYTVTVTRATPPAPVTVTLTPRTEGLTFFDLTVQWNDTQACDNRYFVTVRRNDGYIVRNMGFHPAETTSATLVTYWPMDNVPDFVAVVECDPSSGPRREVGRMSLRSARN